MGTGTGNRSMAAKTCCVFCFRMVSWLVHQNTSTGRAIAFDVLECVDATRGLYLIMGLVCIIFDNGIDDQKCAHANATSFDGYDWRNQKMVHLFTFLWLLK